MSMSASCHRLFKGVGFVGRGNWEGLTATAAVGGGKVVGTVVRKVVHQPTVSQRAVSHVGHAEFSGSVDQAIRLMQRLESRVLCLDGVNLGDCERVSSSTLCQRSRP